MKYIGDQIGKLDGVLEAALAVVQVVEENSDRLTDGQRYQMVFHTMTFWAWSVGGDIDLVGEYVAIINDELTYSGFVDHHHNSTFELKARKLANDLLSEF